MGWRAGAHEAGLLGTDMLVHGLDGGHVLLAVQVARRGENFAAQTQSRRGSTDSINLDGWTHVTWHDTP